MAEQWYLRQLKVAASELVGPDGAEHVETLGVYELENFVDESFLERNRLIMQAASQFDIDPNELMNQSNEDIKSLLGITEAVKSVLSVKDDNITDSNVNTWKLLPYHMQTMILAQLPTIDDVAAFCRLLGKKMCANARIFQRLFSYKYGSEYGRYLKDHPDHINPEWMLRAYEVGNDTYKPRYAKSRITDFRFEHTNGNEIVIKTDFMVIYLGRGNWNESPMDSQLQTLTQSPDTEEYIEGSRFVQYKEDAPFNYPRYLEKVVYGFLKLGFVQTPFISYADSLKTCIGCSIRNIAGKCDQCGQKYCKECFEGVHARKHE